MLFPWLCFEEDPKQETAIYSVPTPEAQSKHKKRISGNLEQGAS